MSEKSKAKKAMLAIVAIVLGLKKSILVVWLKRMESDGKLDDGKQNLMILTFRSLKHTLKKINSWAGRSAVLKFTKRANVELFREWTRVSECLLKCVVSLSLHAVVSESELFTGKQLRLAKPESNSNSSGRCISNSKAEFARQCYKKANVLSVVPLALFSEQCFCSAREHIKQRVGRALWLLRLHCLIAFYPVMVEEGTW